MDPDSDLKAEVARLATLGELDRMVELASVHRKVWFGSLVNFVFIMAKIFASLLTLGSIFS